MRKIVTLSLVGLVFVLMAGSCAKAPSKEPVAAADKFAELVSQADAAYDSGDAKEAFDLYTQALDLPEADDADGAVAAKQAHAKSVFIARNLLARGPNSLDPTDSVTVLVEHSDAETETVEAKRRLIAFLQSQADGIRRDTPELRATIAAEKEFKVPATIYVANSMADLWTRSFTRIPGDFGVQVTSALGLLTRAAAEGSKVADEKWVEDCMVDLDKCEATLAELDAILAAMRAQVEELAKDDSA